jgi:hypothetical protein
LPAIATAFETWGVTPAAAKAWAWLLETLAAHLHAIRVTEPPILVPIL